jgi:hypothetical protein
MGANRKAPTNIVDSPMAAAASTLLYQLQYVGDDGKYASDHLNTIEDLCTASEDDVDDKDYKPSGLVFSDDEDSFLIDIDYESEDERLRSSFPKNNSRMNIIPGGPEPPISPSTPNLNGMLCWLHTLLRGRRSPIGIAIGA